MTVALDAEPDYQWIDAAPPHIALIDRMHITDELFGFVNVPMAVWIDEDGVIVRPAELASITPVRDVPIPDDLPERMKVMYAEVKKLRGQPTEYRAAIADWVERGGTSRFALTPEEVVARSQPRGVNEARAAAFFALGEYVRERGGDPVPLWREAHRLYPSNWTYKRQAWTFVTTPAGAPAPDLIQGPNDVYEGNWLDDVLAAGGGEHYYPPLLLD